MHIKVVRRLIEHQEVGLADDRFGQCHPCFLTSTQHLDLFIRIIATKQEATQYGAQFQFSFLTAGILHLIQDGIVDIECFQLVLCIETLIHIMAPAAVARKRFYTGDDAQYRGFTFTIGADQGDLITPVDLGAEYFL